LIFPASVTNTKLLRFHHIGLAVAEPDVTFRFLALQGYTEGNRVFDPLQGVNLAMRHHERMPDFEVIWPGSEPSPIDKMIKRHGTIMYHCCYETDRVDDALQVITDAGFDMVTVSPPKPAILFGGREVSFHLVDKFGLIELLSA
jgi:Glyoxalase/Bleomycin resistance protein/Dioxygenase superfamily